jgi:hypothetical protein
MKPHFDTIAIVGMGLIGPCDPGSRACKDNHGD